MISNYQAIQKNWFIKRIAEKNTYLRENAGVKLMGILNYATGEVYCEEHDKYDAQVLNDFLENVPKQYANRKIVMILDNAKIHRAKLI